jgi:hypothetical protein
MKAAAVMSGSDLIRQHASEIHLAAARRRAEATVSINVGAVHKALGLSNRVPLVCAALGSKKFLAQNGLRLISKTGPPSGLSTTVTFTYEFLETQPSRSPSPATRDAWSKLRGSLKDVYAELGGGEAYLRAERNAFRTGRDHK